MPPTVLIDSNVLISYLLSDLDRRTTIVTVVQIALRGDVQWVVPQEQLRELEPVIAEPKFGERITAEMWAAFRAELHISAAVLPLQEYPPLPFTRDRNDDYLIAAAIRHDVDILVSGDKDLLAMARFLEVPRIMSPAEFVAEFGEADQ